MNDRNIVTVEQGDLDEMSDMALAKEVGDVLCKHYPNHPWMVSVQGRAVIIRHMAIAAEVAAKIGREGFGSVLPKLGSPKHISHTAMQFGGELLEAFGLPRGKWDGRDPVCPDWNKQTPYKQKGFQ